MILTINHKNDTNFTLSKMIKESDVLLFKTLLFLSFEIIHTQASQIIVKNVCDNRGIPAEVVTKHTKLCFKTSMDELMIIVFPSIKKRLF